MAECVFVSFFTALFGSACLALTVTGCGGGGGAGDAGLIVTMPDQTAPLPVLWVIFPRTLASRRSIAP